MALFERAPVGRAREPGEVLSDARRARDHPRLDELDPEAGRRVRVRRRLLLLALAATFLGGLVHALFGDDGVLDRSRLVREQARLATDIDERLRRVEILAAEVRGLEGDPMRLERIARERLGYVRPGEVVFLLPEAPPVPGEPLPAR